MRHRFPFACFSHRKPGRSPQRFSHQSHPPLYLRDLCAMLSPFRLFLAPEAQTFTAALPHNPIPSLCDLRDLCAMLSPFRLFLAPEAQTFTGALSPSIPIPLCDLRDLCAMLSPFRLFLAPEAPMSTEALLPPIPSVTSVTSSPL